MFLVELLHVRDRNLRCRILALVGVQNDGFTYRGPAGNGNC